MAYKIDLSLKLKNLSSATNTINKLVDDSYYFGCEEHFVNYEFINKKKIIIRNHCVITLTFPLIEKYMLDFIKYVKNDRNVYIETLAIEDFSYKILYASKRYLNIMEKGKAKEYNENKKKGLLHQNPLFVEIKSR
tara:strand:- start:2468 stop:2872 length:405 start_codon:yes stop_codon:yes gene_type:complete